MATNETALSTIGLSRLRAPGVPRIDAAFAWDGFVVPLDVRVNVENKAWWRGSFPSWIVAALLGLICWLGVRLVNEHDAVVRRSMDSSEKIIVLELSVKQHLEQMIELKSINRGIQLQLEQLRDDLRLIAGRRPAATPPKGQP